MTVKDSTTQLAAAGAIALALLASSAPALAQTEVASAAAGDPPPHSVSLTSTQLFEFADAARDAGDFVTAIAAYRALAENPDTELRSEARFRLGMMLADQQQKYRAAAVEFRKILDEKPDAARVRIELARMQVMMGNLGAAEREFRTAQSAGLPPEVERLVRFYANALSARKPFGASLEVALAPDNNINRATRSDTLGTIIGDFTLDQDAKARSGLGLTTRGQAYLRTGIDKYAQLLVRLSGSATIYQASQFDDMAVSLQIGPEYSSGADRISLAAGPSWRWFGLELYSFSYGVSGNYRHPLGKRAQLTIDSVIAHTENRRNSLQNGEAFTLSLGIDRAFSSRFGGGVQFNSARETARDPGYATASGGISGYLYREIGKTTATATLSYNHLEADERLFLYLQRRRENRIGASIQGTLRSLRIGSFAPYAKLRFERNWSTIEIYDYRRLAAEFGLTAAF